MKLEKEELILNLKDFFKQNSRQYMLDIVFLYGSWAGGCPHSNSDIDLAILFSGEVADEDRIFVLITDISYKLQVELNCEVNVISIEEDFPQPLLYYNAVIFGKPLFIKNISQLLNLKLQVLQQKEDFKIFGVHWQQEIAGNLLK